MSRQLLSIFLLLLALYFSKFIYFLLKGITNPAYRIRNILLHRAIRSDNLPQIQKLLSHGANPNIPHHRLAIPPLLSALSRHCALPVIEQLIKAGADVNAITSNGLCPLNMAFKHPQTLKVLELLLKAGGNAKQGNALSIAAYMEPDAQAVKMLLQHGADLNEQDSVGLDPIFASLTNPNPEIFQILLDAGASISHRYSTGTLLESACKLSRHPQTIRSLLKLSPKEEVTPKLLEFIAKNPYLKDSALAKELQKHLNP